MREFLSLDDTWEVNWVRTFGDGVAFGFPRDERPAKIRCATGDWFPGQVPGQVQRDLLEQGKIEDPFYADNADHIRWMEEREWWYRRAFTVPAAWHGRRLRLLFHGLDTCAAIYLNGHEIARHANMFRPLEVDVTAGLRYGAANTLAVAFFPVNLVSGFRPGDGTSGFTTPHRVHTRKAQFSFGWDIAPRLMTVGIWKSVELVALEAARIVSACVRTTALGAADADVEFVAEIERLAPDCREAELAASVAGRTFSLPVHFGQDAVVELRHTLRLEGIKPWQPVGRGEPALYPAEVTLTVAGANLDNRRFRFGLRTVELVEEPQADGGTSFYFRVNGQPLFIKGLNWTPPDALLCRVDEARYRALIARAREASCNLLRVWGGGVYEDDIFYDLCDENGILVWQDFMLGCGIYPQDMAFRDEIRREAEHQVRRLRSHPSLAIWAGDNENDCFYYYAGRTDYRQNALNRDVLPRVIARLSPEVPYIPSSPCSPRQENPLCDREGDHHLWDHLAPHDAEPYASDQARFMSEMGRLALPPLKVIERFLPERQRWPLTSSLWQYHAADCDRVGFGDRMNQLVECLAASGREVPADLPAMVEATQRLQADAYRHWIQKYHASAVCGGIILWNLCDCWPQMSDAILAYPEEPKAAFFAVAEEYAKIVR